jgi:UDP-N-acetylglucosamine 2-epimerase (non-hydrolysing)
MRFMCVAGARPNFVKIKPVVDALTERGGDVDLVHTGQHYDDALSAVFFRDLGLRLPDHVLEAGSGSHAEQTARVMVGLERRVASHRPDVVITVGDVNSTMAAALVGAKAGVFVAHVEAGLRSRDWRMPEEVNRVVTDRVSDFLFAPSADAVSNLRAEGYRDDQIYLVGNVMVDSLLAAKDRATERPVLAHLGLTRGEFGLVTLHRPENVDRPDVLHGLIGTLARLSAELPLVLPAHPRLARMLAGVQTGPIEVIGPQGYLDFIALEAGARLVLTDSGGVQEETTVLGVPCLTLRDSTERPITVTEGTNVVVGRDPDRIRAAFADALGGPVEPRRPPLWDGQAGRRIAEVLLDADQAHPRPTAVPDPHGLRTSTG